MNNNRLNYMPRTLLLLVATRSGPDSRFLGLLREGSVLSSLAPISSLFCRKIVNVKYAHHTYGGLSH